MFIVGINVNKRWSHVN